MIKYRGELITICPGGKAEWDNCIWESIEQAKKHIDFECFEYYELMAIREGDYE